MSGSGGVVAVHTADRPGWQRRDVPQAEALDFRDLEALEDGAVVLMSAGPGEASRIYRSEDQGHSWQEVVRNTDADGFWDGMAFWQGGVGLLVGDPVDGHLTLLRTEDGGRHWQPLPQSSRPPAEVGEYCFAASGTSLAVHSGGLAWLATGGTRARVWRSEDHGDHWQEVPTPMIEGGEGTGIFSIAFRDALHGVIVGGDYLQPDARLRVAAYTDDGGKHWRLCGPEQSPGGYRSGVCWSESHQAWIAVGPNGSDWSRDGRRWQPLAESAFHAVDGEFLSGPAGAVGRLLRATEASP